MRPLVYLIHVTTLQNALWRMTADLGTALEGLGCEVRRFDTFEAAASFFAAPDPDAAGRPCGLVAFNVYGFVESGLLERIRALDLPLFFLSTDHPYLGFLAHRTLIEGTRRMRLSLTNEAWVPLAERLHGDPGVFTLLRQAAAPLAATPWDRRDIPHLVVGNNPITGADTPLREVGLDPVATHDPALFRAAWPRLCGVEQARRLNHMVEIAQAEPMAQLADIVDRGIEDDGADREYYAHIIDIYLRAEVRLAVMRMLLPHPALICGLGWEFLRGQPSKAHFLGSVESDKVLTLIGRARRMYNLVPGYYASSERVIEAAMLGSPVISTPTPFLAEDFAGALTLCAAEDAFAAAIAADDPADRERAERARAIALARHTWTSRAAEIVSYFESEAGR